MPSGGWISATEGCVGPRRQMRTMLAPASQRRSACSLTLSWGMMRMTVFTRRRHCVLASAQQRVRQSLSESPRNSIVVDRLPGRHRVPRGGLLLDARDSPANGHNVYLRGRQGITSISGGEPVSGWKLASDPTLPKAVYSAPAPAALRNTSARHLFVDGSRAVRTRRNATRVLPGLKLDERSECLACSYSVNATDVLSWSNPGDVEFVYSGVLASWAEERCTVDTFGPLPPLPPPPPPPPSGSCSGTIHIHHTQGCFNYSDWKQGALGSVFPTYVCVRYPLR